MPGFTAEATLYKTSGHYHTISIVSKANGAIRPMIPILRDVEIKTLYKPWFDKPWLDSFWRDSIWIDSRSCCQDCLARCFCADEQCRRQCRSSCSIKCEASDIGGCGCPPDRAVCEGQCCRSGEVCTADGCCPPNQVSNNRCCGLLDRHTAEGCCPPGRVICNNRCCLRGETCINNTCASACGNEGEPPCANMTCHGNLHPHWNPNLREYRCTAFCGHAHQPACFYPAPGDSKPKFRCFDHTMLYGYGQSNLGSCMCVPNTYDDDETDVSVEGYCVSANQKGGDIADPPDVDD